MDSSDSADGSPSAARTDMDRHHRFRPPWLARFCKRRYPGVWELQELGIVMFYLRDGTHVPVRVPPDRSECECAECAGAKPVADTSTSSAASSDRAGR